MTIMIVPKFTVDTLQGAFETTQFIIDQISSEFENHFGPSHTDGMDAAAKDEVTHQLLNVYRAVSDMRQQITKVFGMQVPQVPELEPAMKSPK